MVQRFPLIILIVLLVLGGYGVYTQVSAAGRDAIPAASTDVPLAHASSRQEAVFAGGCFWGVQSVFQRVKGVLDTTAGYSGGSADTATYDQVTTETTGHAESVEVVYDPSVITYGQLLRIFFSVVHDPTQLNRQGPDVGTSYRSAIFYDNDEQQQHRPGLHRAARRRPRLPQARSSPRSRRSRASTTPRTTTRTTPSTTPTTPTSRSATAPRSKPSSTSSPSSSRTTRANSLLHSGGYHAECADHCRQRRHWVCIH